MEKEKEERKEHKAGSAEWMDWAVVTAAALFSPLFLFPRIEYAPVFLVFPALFILRYFRKGEFFRRTVVDYGIGLLFFQVMVVSFDAERAEAGLPKIAGVVFGLIVFYALVNLLGGAENPSKTGLFRAGIFVYLAGGMVLSVIAVLGVDWGSDPFMLLFGDKVKNFFWQINKNTPLLNLGLEGAEEGFNPNAFAGTLCLFVPLAVAMFIYFRRGTNRKGVVFFLAVCLAAMFVLVFFSMSVGTWIALFVSVWFVFMARRWTRSSFYVFVSIAVLLFVFNLRIFPEFNQTAQYKYEVRMGLWSEGIEAVGENPWSGAGLNRFRLRPGVKYELSHAHNHLIHTAAELGIPGLVAYLAILAGAGYMCIMVWKKGRDEFARMAVLGLGAGQMAHLLFGMADSIPLGAKPGVLFWISLALITAIYNHTAITQVKRDVPQ